eukprot:jgi/Undpi1/12324/HiC_scaffold_5.g02000.m1
MTEGLGVFMQENEIEAPLPRLRASPTSPTIRKLVGRRCRCPPEARSSLKPSISDQKSSKKDQQSTGSSRGVGLESSLVSGGLLLGLLLGSEEGRAEEVRCEVRTRAAQASSREDKAKAMTMMSSERRELRQVALAYLTKSMLENEAARAAGADAQIALEGTNSNSDSGSDGGGSGGVPAIMRTAGSEGGDDGDDDGGDLPIHLYDLDRVLNKTPLAQTDNAFHDTMNADDRIRCPYVLNKPGPGVEGMEAVLRFGKSVAGHPKIVHGGVTALAFDNLLGMALFLQGVGAVFTAYLKVEYQAPLPCLTTAVIDVTIDKREGRKLFVTGRLKSLDGVVQYASAEALFITPRK